MSFSEAATVLKKVFFKILRNSQEMHCAAVTNNISWLDFHHNGMYSCLRACSFTKKETLAHVFLWILWFFCRTPPARGDCFLQKQSSRNVLRKRCSKICSKFTGEHPCRSVISIKLQSNFIEITPWHRCSPVNLLHIFRTPFLRNTSGWLLPFLLFNKDTLV